MADGVEIKNIKQDLAEVYVDGVRIGRIRKSGRVIEAFTVAGEQELRVATFIATNSTANDDAINALLRRYERSSGFGISGHST